MLKKYIPSQFEKKWIEVWEKDKTYKAKEGGKKQYILAMFPYPSGAGLHVGHVRNYTGTDVVARFYRMNGYSVLHPMGWDAFGLPAENAAIKAKMNPMDMVPDHIKTFKRQMKMLGFSYDWDREFATTDPSYYKWTQWLFIQFYKMGLLYKKNAPINFCPFCKTGCSEEEILSNGTHERCGTKLIKKELPQWLFRITSYADRLLEGLKDLDWPKGILEMQKNWIGKEKGLSIDFSVSDSKETISVWTKYWETVFGVTFLVVAPEYEWLQDMIKQNKVSKEVKQYVADSLIKTDEQRSKEEKSKTCVFTGYYAVNPVNNKKVPIWVADYVLAGVGTGAVMGVPAHDERDMEFVKKYKLPVIQVISKDKTIINSGQFNGMSAEGEGKTNMAEWMISKKYARWQLHYHLRDWIFSRQRYWGEPIPMIHCKKDGWVPVPEKELPVELPKIKTYGPTGTGESPLSAIKNWVNVKCPNCGGPAGRETDTMPNWAGSCWYFLRFADPKNEKQVWSQMSIKNWLPVDWYLGGAEHAVLHLLYSRFWVKALYDLKLLNFKEPFLRLRNQGMVIAEDSRKMSKSFGNVINPDDVVKEFSADTLRVYEMFMAPFNQEIAWSTNTLQGSYRFLYRIWNLFHSETSFAKSPRDEDKGLISQLNKTIEKITHDIAETKFNTSIAAMMEFINHWENKKLTKENAQKFLKVLAPFAPFITEEIWHSVFGENDSIHRSSWPTVDSKQIIEAAIRIPVQVNGKVRAVIELASSEAPEHIVLQQALTNERIKKYIEGKKYKTIYRKGKVLNFVLP